MLIIEFYFLELILILIPFVSHPIMDFNWQYHFRTKFKSIGDYIKKNDIRITMHPGQYTVLNSTKDKVYHNSLKELGYHTNVLDLLELDSTAKIITHVGGVNNDKKASIKRFIQRYHSLEKRIKKYFVIENDDRSYNIRDCLEISEQTSIPVIFDLLHYKCYATKDGVHDITENVFQTWEPKDGLPIVHYSSENLIKGKKIRRWRAYTPKRAVEETNTLVDYGLEHGIKIYGFLDPCFGYNKKWLDEFLNLYVADEQIIYHFVETRVDILNEQIISKLQERKMFQFYGVETFSKKILNIMNKSYNLNEFV